MGNKFYLLRILQPY